MAAVLGKGPGPEREVGTAPWIRGMLRGLLTTEALRTAVRALREPAPDGRAGAVGARTPQPHAGGAQGDGGGGPARRRSPFFLVVIMKGAEREVPAVGRHAVDRHH